MDNAVEDTSQAIQGFVILLMNMYNAFYEGAVTMPDNNIQTSDGRIKKIFPHISIKLIVAVVIVLVVAGFIVHKITQKHQGFPVVIGSTHITLQDVNNYATEIRDYVKSAPESEFGGSPAQVAVNDLVLNAAFKNEAQKLKQPLTNADIVNASYQQFSTAAQKQQYINKLDSSNTMIQVRAQNLAYEQKFANTLIDRKTLTIAGINFDSPYFDLATKSQAQTRYNQAIARLQNTVVPLFKEKASNSVIAQHSDVAFKNMTLTRGVDNYQQYFQKAVLTTQVETGYTNGQALFHDENNTSYIKGNIGTLYSTDAKIDSLKQVGDYTGVFASKAGIFMDIRLDSETGGGYNSWNDFLAHYKQEYGLTSVSLTKQLRTKIASSINNVVQTLASFEQGQASADILLPNGSYCSQHNVQFIGRSWDDTGNVPIGGSGTTFQEYRPTAIGNAEPCPGTLSGTQSATTGGPGSTLYDNCFSVAPSWSVTGLAGAPYTPVAGGPYGVTPSNTGANYAGYNVTWSNDGIAIRSGPDSDKDSGNNTDGWPAWNPDSINNTGNIYIIFLYTHNCTDCSPCAADYPCTTPIPTAASVTCTTFSTDTPPKGDFETYWISDSSGNTEVGATDTGVGAASGSFKPYGQVMTLYAYSVNVKVTTSGVVTTYGPTHSWNSSGNCFSATCTMSIPGNLPDGGILAGSNFTVNYTIYNTSQPGVTLFNTLPPNNTNLDLTQPGPSQQDVNYAPGIGPGGSQTFSYTATAQDSSGVYSTTGYPDYYGDFALGGGCNNNNGVSAPVEVRAASCTITSTGPIPGGYVQAGQPFTATAIITNTGTAVLPANDTNGDPFSFNYGDSALDASSTYWSYPDNNLGVTLFPGQSTSVTFTLPAGSPYAPQPPTSSTEPSEPTLWGHVAYSNDFALSNTDGSPTQCSDAVDMYVPFGLTGTSQVTPLDASGKPTTDEDPSSFSYATGVTSTAPVPVDASTTSTVYEVPQATGVRSYYNPPGTVSNGGPFNSGANSVIGGTDKINPPLEAGDTYNSEIDLGYTAAYVGDNGPTDIVDATGATDYPAKFTIENDPFFKVYGSGVFAGGSFSNIDDTCTAGGYLASWNNNDSGTYPTSGDYGASAQFGALALQNIIGFASAQTPNFGRSPTALSFANTANVTEDTYGPELGGKFGSSQCFTPQTPQTPTTAIASPTIDVSSLVNTHGNNYGSYTATGNVTLNAGQIAAGNNVSLSVTGGNVYITGAPGSGITYGGSGGSSWTVNGNETETSNVPSFSLVVNGGSIYINNNLVELDGLYTAQPSVSPSGGGEIYTCALGNNDLVATANMFSGCNNQLTVYGNFVANKVVLMRTFGSLRDETPTPPTSGGSSTTAPSQPPSKRPTPLYNYFCSTTDVNTSGGYYTTGDASTGSADCLPGDTSQGFQSGAAGTIYIYPCETASSSFVYIDSSESCPTGSSAVTFGATAPLSWYTSGASIPSADNCAKILEPSEPGGQGNPSGTPTTGFGLGNDYLCVPPSDGAGSGQVQLSWSCNDFLSNPGGCNSGSALADCTANIGDTINNSPWNYPSSYTWTDNEICSNYPISFAVSNSNPSDSTQYCTSMNDPSDTAGSGVWQKAYICIQKGSGGTSNPATAANGTNCSNSAGAIQNSSLQPLTCAAEVFDFSPELYLSTPAIAPTNAGGYTPSAISSLPPVL